MIVNNRIKPFPPHEAAHDLGEFLHDLVELAELQVELVAAETRQSARNAARFGTLALFAAAIAIGTTPVALGLLASVLMDVGMDRTPAVAISAGAGVLLACALALGARSNWRSLRSPYRRSREELGANLKCVKHSLRRGRRGRTSPIDYQPNQENSSCTQQR